MRRALHGTFHRSALVALHSLSSNSMAGKHAIMLMPEVLSMSKQPGCPHLQGFDVYGHWLMESAPAPNLITALHLKVELPLAACMSHT